MSVEVTRRLLLWCAVINYGLLLLWVLLVMVARDLMQRILGRWFRLSNEQFDTLQLAGISMYKIAIILFNLVPAVVLYLMF